MPHVKFTIGGAVAVIQLSKRYALPPFEMWRNHHKQLVKHLMFAERPVPAGSRPAGLEQVMLIGPGVARGHQRNPRRTPSLVCPRRPPWIVGGNVRTN
jgi:hypothetical protein